MHSPKNTQLWPAVATLRKINLGIMLFLRLCFNAHCTCKGIQSVVLTQYHIVKTDINEQQILITKAQWMYMFVSQTSNAVGWVSESFLSVQLPLQQFFSSRCFVVLYLCLVPRLRERTDLNCSSWIGKDVAVQPALVWWGVGGHVVLLLLLLFL